MVNVKGDGRLRHEQELEIVDCSKTNRLGLRATTQAFYPMAKPLSSVLVITLSPGAVLARHTQCYEIFLRVTSSASAVRLNSPIYTASHNVQGR
jgi:hypothetical protein